MFIAKLQAAGLTYLLNKNKLIDTALRCLENRVKYLSDTMNHPNDVANFLRLSLAPEPNEVFAVLFLDNAQRVIAFEKLFFGTIHKAAVHPRVVVKRALELNAAAVILAHNHPSGDTDPSEADKKITRRLKDILAIIDVKVLDHFIVSSQTFYSFAMNNFCN